MKRRNLADRERGFDLRGHRYALFTIPPGDCGVIQVSDGIVTKTEEVAENGPGMVLVVDDDPAVLKVASKVLSRGGYDVLEANGGREALALADEHEGAIALVLTDVVMPGMGGRELAEELRARYPALPVVFMSAYTQDEVLIRGVEIDEVDFVHKPFTVQGLRDKVGEVLARGSD